MAAAALLLLAFVAPLVVSGEVPPLGELNVDDRGNFQAADFRRDAEEPLGIAERSDEASAEAVESEARLRRMPSEMPQSWERKPGRSADETEESEMSTAEEVDADEAALRRRNIFKKIGNGLKKAGQAVGKFVKGAVKVAGKVVKTVGAAVKVAKQGAKVLDEVNKLKSGRRGLATSAESEDANENVMRRHAATRIRPSPIKARSADETEGSEMSAAEEVDADEAALRRRSVGDRLRKIGATLAVKTKTVAAPIKGRSAEEPDVANSEEVANDELEDRSADMTEESEMSAAEEMDAAEVALRRRKIGDRLKKFGKAVGKVAAGAVKVAGKVVKTVAAGVKVVKQGAKVLDEVNKLKSGRRGLATSAESEDASENVMRRLAATRLRPLKGKDKGRSADETEESEMSAAEEMDADEAVLRRSNVLKKLAESAGLKQKPKLTHVGRRAEEPEVAKSDEVANDEVEES